MRVPICKNEAQGVLRSKYGHTSKEVPTLICGQPPPVDGWSKLGLALGLLNSPKFFNHYYLIWQQP